VAVKLYKNSAWLIKRYTIERKTVDEMAQEAGVTSRTIYNKLKQIGLIK
jgi:transcriptional regulator of acetoin/glycerol metabolism